MKEIVRTIVWISLIAGGFLAVIIAVVTAQPRVAVAVGIGSVGTWIAWGFVSSYYFGIRRHIVEHLGPGWKLGVVVKHPVRTAERVNVQAALDYLLERDGDAGPFGLGSAPATDDEGANMGYVGQQDLIQLLDGNPEPVPISWEQIATSEERKQRCAANALYLLNVNDQPSAVLVQSRARLASKRAMMHILARDQAAADLTLEQLLRVARERSIYRGRIISIQRHDSRNSDFSVQFHDIAPVPRESIILPEEVLATIERNVVGFFRHADALKAAGQGARHGALLHGPPGTGKTLVTRYLAQASQVTVLFLTGKQYAYLKPTCQLAKLLAPSLVVLEDVDLIATERRKNRHRPLLHELMDEMDGLGATADIVFLLTTNRPESLEEALASRPGRVDQAICFPLPDLECRRRLFAQFSKGLEVTGMDLGPLLERTEGASPAFIKELFRRAALMAIERGAKGDPLPLVEDDFEVALRELLEAGGELTRSFLGFPSRR